ncbi:hypothetical protein PHYPO_G00114010 [Pangasianodon hypophthalmus]|uniref:Uncharacterized protein n=1 Tax=Pangasianodon hypophthalmus TaxID=310915 RepID=A0A5N5L2T4_PANHP|nr:hypothetical protein PHYPO_G00114010 [Pangasianodon hypophthalmus]
MEQSCCCMRTQTKLNHRGNFYFSGQKASSRARAHTDTHRHTRARSRPDKRLDNFFPKQRHVTRKRADRAAELRASGMRL